MKRTVVLNRYKDTAFAWHRYMASGAVMLNWVADFALALKCYHGLDGEDADYLL